MAARTKPFNFNRYEGGYDLYHPRIATGVSMPYGTLAVIDGTNGAKPLTQALVAAGAVLAGLVDDPDGYANSTGAAVDQTRPVPRYRRGCIATAEGKSGDAPTRAGQTAYLDENFSIRLTSAGGPIEIAVVVTRVLGNNLFEFKLP
jgi:hypothetical protein